MMNMISLILVVLVIFTFFGGQNVPKFLKDNKQMILGIFVGVLLHQFMGIGIEGVDEEEGENEEEGKNEVMQTIQEKISSIYDQLINFIE